MTHLVRDIGFDFRAEQEAFAHTLYGKWEAFFAASVERILEEVLDRHDTAGCQWEIDRLDLHLGAIPEADFYDRFPLLFREALEEELVSLHATPPEKGVRKLPQADRALELLREFLLRGTLSADRLSAFGGTLKSLFRYVVRERGASLARFLRSYGHYTGLQQRLVYQLDDPELEAGVGLLAPSDSGFICGYTRWLRRKYRAVERPEMTAGQYRDTVWQVVYAYLLNDRGSVFNRKHFLRGTIAALAGKLSLDYGELLRILSDGIGELRKQAVELPELPTLIEALRQEADLREKERLNLDTGKLCRTLAEVIRRGEMTAASEWFPWLTGMLRREAESVFLLRMLDEPHIRSLVPAIVPAQAPYVWEYADTLDREERQGLFEGKAGSDFRLVKWAAIFAALLENPGVGFNRLYFVERVLARLAAHYNLMLYDLLRFLNSEEPLARIDPRLPEILKRLLAKYTPAGETPAVSPVPEAQLENWLENPASVPEGQRDTLFEWLGRETFRREWLRTHRETDCLRLLEILVPEEVVFLREYVRQLNEAGKEYTLEGRSGGSFRQIKWEFIFGTIVGRSGHALTRKYLVRRSLSGLAAHYNLAYVELLLYFLREPTAVSPLLRETLLALLKEELGTQTGDEKSTDRDSALWQAIGSVCSAPVQTFLEAFREWSERLLRQIAPADVRFQKLFALAFRKLCVDWMAGGLLSGRRHFRPADFIREIARRTAAFSPFSPEEMIRWWTDTRKGAPVSGTILPENRKNSNPHKTPSQTDVKPLEQEIMDKKIKEPIHVQNAGIAVVFPYLPQLFLRLNYLVDNRLFHNDESRIRAIFVLQYLIQGEAKEYAEPQLVFNKVLTAFPAGKPLPRQVELTEKEKTTAEELLTGVRHNWSKLQKTSNEALRQAFLQRPGKLEEQKDRYRLTVEEKPYDLLLDSVQWNFRLIRFPWMEKRIEVKWRG